MLISALKESPGETRTALTPQAAKQYIAKKFEVAIESGAGLEAGFSDAAYEQVGVQVNSDRNALLSSSDLILSVNPVGSDDIKHLKKEAMLIGHYSKVDDKALLEACCNAGISMISMNYIPRISRAQSIDSLSSQANLAGYRAVIEACYYFKRAVPMMMTAAGMIHPAKVMVLGAGVAGLQAIATAKRLGAVVYAFDVRKAAKEQVESLGAEFIEVEEKEDNESAGGYAKETSEAYQQRQSALIDEYASKSDIIITTALIPEKKAPVLIRKETVKRMKPGSVVVDLATSRGGNCEVSVAGEVIKAGDVSIIGWTNLAAALPTTASDLYANNLLNLVKILSGEEAKITLNKEDDILIQALLCHQGKFLPFQSNKEQLV